MQCSSPLGKTRILRWAGRVADKDNLSFSDLRHASLLQEAGRFTACWNILVLAYVCYQMRRYPNADPASTRWQFAHPLEPCQIRFLGSQECPAAIRKSQEQQKLKACQAARATSCSPAKTAATSGEFQRAASAARPNSSPSPGLRTPERLVHAANGRVSHDHAAPVGRPSEMSQMPGCLCLWRASRSMQRTQKLGSGDAFSKSTDFNMPQRLRRYQHSFLLLHARGDNVDVNHRHLAQEDAYGPGQAGPGFSITNPNLPNLQTLEAYGKRTVD
ncbi:hypothetical protein WJX74_000673 [Apatococcus lobatus]|uniref:Uncharacterized protein n=1 Tax=Apatococcus lobatus TaxID=904363 RepID=A0AAW1SAT1_9CHLO